LQPWRQEPDQGKRRINAVIRANGMGVRPHCARV
jgi:hypothetical protein